MLSAKLRNLNLAPSSPKPHRWKLEQPSEAMCLELFLGGGGGGGGGRKFNTILAREWVCLRSFPWVCSA